MCFKKGYDLNPIVISSFHRLDDMMCPPSCPQAPPSAPPTSLFPVLILLLFLPPSLVSSSLSHAPLSWTSPHDPCYHLDGRPRHCMSEFINAAYGTAVNASHALGAADGNVTALTDLHNPHNLTCWAPRQGSASGGWVLTVPLGRRFEITYISLQFCQQGAPSDPLSITILKSMDYGRTWRPMQHYSSDCVRDFGLPAQTAAQTRHQEAEALCSDPRPLQKQRGGTVLAFSALDGRPSSPDFDHSHTLQDWVTATDVRVVFHQVPRDPEVAHVDRIEEVRSSHYDQGEFFRWRLGYKGPPGDRVTKTNPHTLTLFDGEVKDSEMKARGDKYGRKGHYKGSGRDQDGHNATSKEGGDGFRSPGYSKRGGRGRGRGRKKESNHWLPCPDGGCNWTVVGRGGGGVKGRELRKRRNNNQRSSETLRSLQAPQVPLALADLQVGGRCKCNGHASRCRRDDAGQAVCVCQHHTAGPDCDVCEDFYCDRPWHRATPTHANPCVGESNRNRRSFLIAEQMLRKNIEKKITFRMSFWLLFVIQ